MAKQNGKPSMAEDYLHQVEWENHNQVDKMGHAPWKNSPNWKYKRAHVANRRLSQESSIEIIWLVFVIASFGYLIFQIFFGHNGTAILISILVLVFLAILYFMVRETRK